MLDERLSLGVSIVLIAVYIANLIYTLITHRDVFASASEEESGHPGHSAHWSARRAVLVLVAAEH